MHAACRHVGTAYISKSRLEFEQGLIAVLHAWRAAAEHVLAVM